MEIHICTTLDTIPRSADLDIFPLHFFGYFVKRERERDEGRDRGRGDKRKEVREIERGMEGATEEGRTNDRGEREGGDNIKSLHADI